MSGCERFIGQRYRLGADGSDGEIDCIHLVYAVLAELKIPTPSFQAPWYSASTREIYRAIRDWGRPIETPSYDGDVILWHEPGELLAFGVVWATGFLHINRSRDQVGWLPLTALPRSKAFRCSHTSAS